MSKFLKLALLSSIMLSGVMATESMQTSENNRELSRVSKVLGNNYKQDLGEASKFIGIDNNYIAFKKHDLLVDALTNGDLSDFSKLNLALNDEIANSMVTAIEKNKLSSFVSMDLNSEHIKALVKAIK